MKTASWLVIVLVVPWLLLQATASSAQNQSGAYADTLLAIGQRRVALRTLYQAASATPAHALILEQAEGEIVRSVGFEIERVRLAQQASETIIRSLVGPDQVRRFSDVPLGDLLGRVRRFGQGLYIVGLDRHVGFLACDQRGIRFIHSAYLEPYCVVDEDAAESAILSSSRYRVIGRLTGDQALTDRWLTGASIPTVDIFALRLVNAAMERLDHDVTYDGSYRRLAYPGGDVPDDLGVCTDLVIRAYRALGIDLQKMVHEDMVAAFDLYPKRWGASMPDPSIDHRRVPNLQVFFGRHGETIVVTREPDDYRPGDLVTWLLPGNLPHIGIVTGRYSVDGRRPLIVHNIGAGPALDDLLFTYEIDGHYRYRGHR